MAFEGASTLNFGGATDNRGWIPEVFSHKAQIVFRRKSIVEGITNNDYTGEITQYGDTVNIIKEPQITVNSYTRNKTLTAQALTDDTLTLIIDKANEFSFKVDDIEEKFSHINWQTLAADNAAYQLKNTYDQEVLTYMSTEANVLAANVVNDDAEANVLDLSTADALLNQITNLGTRLSLQDVPEENRWIVLNPEALEVLAKADSKLLNMDYNGGATNLKNGLYMEGLLRGFRLYVTNNAPTYTSTGTGGTSVGRFILMAGHMSATATANSITQMETIRDQDTFADIVRGLHVYGRTVLRPEALSIAYVKYA